MTALAIALTAAAGHASAFTIVFNENWGFNHLGTGVGSALTPVDEMTYLGISYTESTGFAAGDTFQDVGRIGATGFQNDGSPIPAGISGLGMTHEISATYLNWTGSYGATVGNNTPYDFNPGGTLNIFVDDTLDNNSFAGASNGINIMNLSILDGAGNINFNNPGGVDGNVNILFEVTGVASGYWFLDTDNDGIADTDVATFLASGNGLTVGLTDSNNNIFTPTSAVRNDFIANTGLGNPTGAGDIYTLNDGSFHPGVAVPEPGTLALLSLGLIGLGAFSRRSRT